MVRKNTKSAALKRFDVVYVDGMRASYGRMVMCHMLSDTEQELHEMAARIGVQRKWQQKAGTPHSHYDIALSKRALAVKFGAVQIDRYKLSELIKAKREATRA
jgi:hypothetical protein